MGFIEIMWKVTSREPGLRVRMAALLLVPQFPHVSVGAHASCSDTSGCRCEGDTNKVMGVKQLYNTGRHCRNIGIGVLFIFISVKSTHHY